ncbi:MAG TPA: hypothetical protein VEW48_22590 [Thermoanaerobaculia bacterium]|nr:hypothetical protein [Thermoanaerobaculia bacterium]
MKDGLYQQEFLVISDASDRVWFRSAFSVLTDHEAALRILTERYGFELRSIKKVLEEDMKNLLVPFNELTSTMQRVVSGIEQTRHKKIRVGRLRDAPAVFRLADIDYLNLENEIFSKANTSAKHRDLESLKSYLLGLLQYELA